MVRAHTARILVPMRMTTFALLSKQDIVAKICVCLQTAFTLFTKLSTVKIFNAVEVFLFHIMIVMNHSIDC